MLPKDKRLSSKQIGEVIKKGQSKVSQALVLKFLAADNLDGSRFAIIVGKALGSSVVRNKLKRRLREILRKLPAKSGFQAVFLAKPKAGKLSFDQLREEIRSLLARAGILN